MATKPERVTLEIADRDVAISNPNKLYFPDAKVTKLDLVRYYLSVADCAAPAASRTFSCAS